jgi:hypothetical protein
MTVVSAAPGGESVWEVADSELRVGGTPCRQRHRYAQDAATGALRWLGPDAAGPQEAFRFVLMPTPPVLPLASPLAVGQSGDSGLFSLADAGSGTARPTRLTFRVTGKEVVETRAGRFEAFRVEGELRREDNPANVVQLTDWYSGDRLLLKRYARREGVKLMANRPTTLGQTVELEKFTPGKS